MTCGDYASCIAAGLSAKSYALQMHHADAALCGNGGILWPSRKGGLRESSGDRAAMLIVGMFFFWIAVTSGLCGFADIFSEHVYALHVVFYASLLLATLTFTVRLLRSGEIHDASVDEIVDRPAGTGAARVDSTDPEASSVAQAAPAAPCREPVIAGPLVAGMR
jgi:hypothetical protein